MVYKLFPSKDASIYSFYPNLNAGIDSVLDLSLYYSNQGTYESSRILIQFPQDQINNLVSNSILDSQFDVYLKLYNAYSSNIPLEYNIDLYAVYETWSMGTGRFSNVPETINGVSWTNNTQLGVWDTSNTASGVTSSYVSGSNIGGGNWYYNFVATQSFSYISNGDIEIPITYIIQNYINNNIPNNGFIIKHSSSLEFNSGSVFETKYFSMDTHTIYPPCLEFRWDDSIFETGSNSVINSNDFVITLQNNKGEYEQDSIQKFRLGVRQKYPVRTFQTSSVYTNSSLLPSSSYWSLKDYKTNDVIVDYDENYTKISSDGTSSFFTLYMNGLERSRYYRILVKVVMSDGSTQVFDDNFIFKII